MNFLKSRMSLHAQRKMLEAKQLDFSIFGFRLSPLNSEKSPRTPRTGTSGTFPSVLRQALEKRQRKFVENLGTSQQGRIPRFSFPGATATSRTFRKFRIALRKRALKKGTRKTPLYEIRENSPVSRNNWQSFKSCRGHQLQSLPGLRTSHA